MIHRLHLLKEYVQALDEQGLVAQKHVPDSVLDKKVSYVSFNSQDIRYDTLFICKGAHFTVDYLLGALEEGAFAYISEVSKK